jgi:hypothetical protein
MLCRDDLFVVSSETSNALCGQNAESQCYSTAVHIVGTVDLLLPSNPTAYVWRSRGGFCEFSDGHYNSKTE